MSVDRTIEELSGTLNQLGILVEHINTQIVGITSRINRTLDNFDTSVAGIATDAGAMTGQVGDTISQVPNAWVFYLLFITLIIVLILLSVLIIISLATRLHAIYHIIKGDRHTSFADSPYPSNYDSKQPLTMPISPLSETKRRHHVTVPMESEPRRYGDNLSYSQPQDPGGYNPFFGKHNLPPPPRNTECERTQESTQVEVEDCTIMPLTIRASPVVIVKQPLTQHYINMYRSKTSRLADCRSSSFIIEKSNSTQLISPPHKAMSRTKTFDLPTKHFDKPIPLTDEVKKMILRLESANEAYLRRPLNPHIASAVQIDPPVPTPTPRYTKNAQYRGEPV